jgi:hemoglobin
MKRNGETLFTRLGGIETVRNVVDHYYDLMVADERLQRFFEGVPLAYLKMHQMRFLKIAFTKFPDDLDIKEYLLKKHATLLAEKGLNETHFDLFIVHLSTALKQSDAPDELLREAMNVIGPLRHVFLLGSKKLGDSQAGH